LFWLLCSILLLFPMMGFLWLLRKMQIEIRKLSSYR
jgi:hypothetical protein